MPDFLLMAKGLLLAGIVAGVVPLLVARTTANPAPWRLAAGWIGGMSAGIYAGCALLGEWPHWPPREDRDRFLVVLLPLVLAVETAAMLLPSRRGVLWMLRVSLAVVTAPILLHNSIYLADLAGPGSAEWSRPQAVLTMGFSAVLLGIVWGFLSLLQSRTSAPLLSSMLATTAVATGFTLMLSGYYRGGLLALPLAGAIAGMVLASCAFPKQPIGDGSLGIGVQGIFSIVFIGRFYGSLPTSLAICLCLSPLLIGMAELPRIRNWPAAARTAFRVAAVLAALILVVTIAQARFNAAAAAGSVPQRTVAASAE